VLRLDDRGWRVRPFRLDDVDSLVRHADSPRVAATLRDLFPQPYTEQDARDWIGANLAAEPTTHFAIANADDEAVGAIGLVLQGDVHQRSAELGFWLGEAYWGQGVMTLAVAAFVRWAFDEFDLLRIFAGVFESNPGSMRVLQKSGFVLEGRQRCAVVKRGEVLDQWVYASVRDPRRVESAPLRLSDGEFVEVVRNTPLVAIDLIVRNRGNEVLVGLRNNAPARGYWFVPGGRVHKDETLSRALSRIVAQELGLDVCARDARFVGLYEHLYPDNYRGDAEFGTHYVVLAHELHADPALGGLPDEQHRAYRWAADTELATDEKVHANTRAYFVDRQAF